MNGGRKEIQYGHVFTGKMLRFLPEQEFGKNHSDKKLLLSRRRRKISRRKIREAALIL